MMQKISLDSHTALALHLWEPPGQPRGILHWLHGMAEHGGRYQSLADAVNAEGWILAVHDHRGHGHSQNPLLPAGFFAEQDGWQTVCQDTLLLGQHLRQRFPNLPLVLGGHSMGSFIALSASQQDSSALSGLILCGTDSKPPLLWQLAAMVARLERARVGATGTSRLLKKLTFDAFAKKITNRQTDFDWLSHRPDIVQAYIADPLCGFDCTTGLWTDLFDGMAKANSNTGFSRLPTHLPILLIAGAEDPMSNGGKGVTRLGKLLSKKHNLRDVALFKPGRHEILNDLCATDAQKKVTDFLKSME